MTIFGPRSLHLHGSMDLKNLISRIELAASLGNYVSLAALLLGYAVEFDVIDELPLRGAISS